MRPPIRAVDKDYREAFKRASPLSRMDPAPLSLECPSSLNHVNKHHNNGEDQENVNESSQRVRTDQAQQPENDQYDRYGP